MLRDHIYTVVGRYKGQIYQWDVANEVFNDDEDPVLRQENIWIRELRPEIIGDVFRWAHEADSEAKLYLIEALLAEGVPVDGFSAQAHLSLKYGFDASLQNNLQRFDDLGLETAITELDIRMPVPAGEEPTEEQLSTQADGFALSLDACLNVEGCNSLTLWGQPDQYSWVPFFFADETAATSLWPDFTTKPGYDALRARLAEAD